MARIPMRDASPRRGIRQPPSPARRVWLEAPLATHAKRTDGAKAQSPHLNYPCGWHTGLSSDLLSAHGAILLNRSEWSVLRCATPFMRPAPQPQSVASVAQLAWPVGGSGAARRGPRRGGLPNRLLRLGAQALHRLVEVESARGPSSLHSSQSAGSTTCRGGPATPAGPSCTTTTA